MRLEQVFDPNLYNNNNKNKFILIEDINKFENTTILIQTTHIIFLTFHKLKQTFLIQLNLNNSLIIYISKIKKIQKLI